mgnify:CR=1 FL=1
MADALYSRQIGALGRDAMRHISKLKVLILGCETIGCEAAKSLALMGVHTLYMHDTTIAKKIHHNRVLGSTIGVRLSKNCKLFIDSLKTDTCSHIIKTKPQIEALFMENLIDCVIMTNHSFNIDLIESLCIQYKKPFIFGSNNELLGYIFVNFGVWDVIDPDGEARFKGHVQSKQRVGDNFNLHFDTNIIPTSKKFYLSGTSGDCEGIVNEYSILKTYDKKTLVANIKYSKSIHKILKSRNVVFGEVPTSAQLNHKKFSESIKNLDYQYINLQHSFGRDDTTYKNYTQFLRTANGGNYDSDFREKRNHKFYLLGSIVGGILAQEVIKTSGKYTPISQEILFNFRELHGTDLYKVRNHTDDLKHLLDKSLIKRIKGLNAFMVGCGALGCEISKNMAMLGFCQSKKSNLVITDMDTIELSNLTRQFLFQPNNIGEYKSLVVKNKLQTYRPNMKVTNSLTQVGRSNEEVFNYNFWQGRDIVINALDNVKARRYVDEKCVCFRKPLFESGTLGVKGNVQVIIPNKTATYSEIKDPPEKNIPMCTIRNFPHTIEHCVEWGLSIFDRVFNQGLADSHDFLDNAADFQGKIELLENVQERVERTTIATLLINVLNTKEYSWVEKLGNYIYIKYCKNIIVEVLDTHKDDDFWSGNKLKPNLLKVREILDIDYYSALLKLLNITKSPSAHFALTPAFEESHYESLEAIPFTSDLLIPKPIHYDKDSTHHLEFMANLTNIRAKCYNITPCDTLQIQLLSGKIIPALSTTTSIVSAFVVLDILKYLSNIATYSETNINIGVNQYTRYNAFRPQVTYNNMVHSDYGIPIKTVPEHFNTWSQIRIVGQRNLVGTNLDLCKFIIDEYGIPDIELITFGNFVVYTNTSETLIRMEDVYAYYSAIQGYCISTKEPLTLELICFDKDGVPILTPPIVYSLM